MTDGLTIIGLDEFLAAVDALPTRVLSASRAVAQSTAQRVMANAKANLEAKQKTDARALADAITVKEDAAHRQFIVDSPSPHGQPANVNLWNEYGTSKMSARPYMHPAVEAENAQYQSDMERVAQDVLDELVR
jgi:HK97 gp10 family phage protein